jgi:hypothetical protein
MVVLHLLTREDAALALASIEAQVAAGDRVSVALLHGIPAPKVPAGVEVQRVPDGLTYPRLLERIFEADQVITW